MYLVFADELEIHFIQPRDPFFRTEILDGGLIVSAEDFEVEFAVAREFVQFHLRALRRLFEQNETSGYSLLLAFNQFPIYEQDVTFAFYAWAADTIIRSICQCFANHLASLYSYWYVSFSLGSSKAAIASLAFKDEPAALV